MKTCETCRYSRKHVRIDWLRCAKISPTHGADEIPPRAYTTKGELIVAGDFSCSHFDPKTQGE